MTLTFQLFPDEIKDQGIVLHGAKIGQNEEINYFTLRTGRSWFHQPT